LKLVVNSMMLGTMAMVVGDAHAGELKPDPANLKPAIELAD
jgi:hypothetical protein